MAAVTVGGGGGRFSLISVRDAGDEREIGKDGQRPG